MYVQDFRGVFASEMTCIVSSGALNSTHSLKSWLQSSNSVASFLLFTSCTCQWHGITVMIFFTICTDKTHFHLFSNSFVIFCQNVYNFVLILLWYP